MSDLEEARRWLGEVTDRDLFIAGIALYAGEVSKGLGSVQLPNSDPRMISLLLTWLRRFFEVDESRLRLWLYLHEGLDLEVATAFWARATGISPAQFEKPYRAKADPSIRKDEAPNGLPCGQVQLLHHPPPGHGARRRVAILFCSSPG